jgi:hypothetical protein
MTEFATELVVGEKYKIGDYEILIIAQSPVTGNYIGEYVIAGSLSRFLPDGRMINNFGYAISEERLIKIPKTIEVEYEFWVNFYKNGDIGPAHKTLDSALRGADQGVAETKRFTHKATYTVTE